MEGFLDSLFQIAFTLLYIAAVIAGFCIVLYICFLTFVGGAIIGMFLGAVMGVKNYFAALFSQVKLRQ